MRIVAVVGGLCLLAILAALVWGARDGDDDRPLVFRHLSRALVGKRSIELHDSPFDTRWQYPLEVKSNVKKAVNLEVRFEGEGGVRVLLAGNKLISRESTDKTTLIVVPANVVGPFAGRAIISSPDLPDWGGEIFHFKGTVNDRGLIGRYLRPRPRAAIDLGEFRPGEEKPFAVALESFGSESVTISSIGVDAPERVRLPRDTVSRSHTVVAGGSFQLRGRCVAPRRAGRFRAAIEVFSDASNYPHSLGVYLSGEVVPDYAPDPALLESRTEYPVMEREHRVTITAREGNEPFRISSVERHERYFDVVSKGSDEPAMEQEVRLKVRRDAPTNSAESAEFTVLFRLEPSGTEIVVPVRMRFYAPIHASPHVLDFGRDLSPREIRVDGFGDRDFKVKTVTAERGRFDVRLRRQRQGMPPIILVSIPKGAPDGILQDRVVIETDDPDVPRLIVPVKAAVR